MRTLHLDPGRAQRGKQKEGQDATGEGRWGAELHVLQLLLPTLPPAAVA